MVVLPGVWKVAGVAGLTVIVREAVIGLPHASVKFHLSV
jgi:hypothetical protein